MIRSSKQSSVKHAQAGAGERGLALLIVLWIIVSAALLVSAFNATVRSGVSFVTSEVQLARTEALLDAGAEIAATRMLDEEAARAWVPDGRRYTVSFVGAQLAISIADANGLIDLNKADAKLLLQFFRQFMGSELKAGRLRDLILQARGKSPGGKGSKAAGPIVAEDDERPGEKGNSALPFVDIAQLRGLEGMTLPLYRKLAPFLTVYSRDGRINPVVAPDQVLAAIPNLTPTDIEKLRSLSGVPKKDDPAIADIAQRAGDYLADEPGPAFLVTVEVLRPGIRHTTGRVYVMAPGLDANAPYRLIAKRPIRSVQLGSAQ